MENHYSREKLVGLEEGVIWQHKEGNPKLLVMKIREQTLTRFVKLLFACTAIVLLVLIFYHFRLSFMEYTSTEEAIERLERIEAERNAMIDSNDLAFDKDQLPIYPMVGDFERDSLSPLQKEIIRDEQEDANFDEKIFKSTEPPKLITISTEKINEASDENNDLPPGLESYFNPDEETTSSWLSFPKLFESGDGETTEASNDINAEKLEVFDSSEIENATSTGESHGFIYRISFNPFNDILIRFGWGNGEESESIEEETENITTEKAREVEGKTGPEEPQTLDNSERIIENDSTDDYEYAYDYSLDDYIPSEEDYGYTDTTDLIPFPDLVENPEEAVKTLLLNIKRGNIVPTSLDIDSLPDTVTPRFKFIGGSINDKDTTKSIENGLSKRDDLVSNDDFIDKYFRESRAKGFVEVDNHRIYDESSIENDSDYSYSWEEEGDSDIWDQFGLATTLWPFTDQQLQSERNADFQAENDLSNTQSSIGEAIDEWNIEETTEKGTTQEAIETEPDPVEEPMTNVNQDQSDHSTFNSDSQLLRILWPESDTGKNDKIPIASLHEDLSRDPPAQESSTIEPSSTSSEKNEDSQENNDEVNDDEVDEAITNLETNLESLNEELMHQFHKLYCKFFDYSESDDMDFLADELSESEKLLVKDCSSLKNEKFDAALDYPIWKRSITGESARETVEDSQSSLKARQIMDTIQRVIVQDRHFLESEESKIFGRLNPVVESRVNNLYKKLEALSTHIDRLHERYLRINKLEDDYVSREFPSDA